MTAIIGLALAAAALLLAHRAYVESLRRERRRGRAEVLRWTGRAS